VRHSTGSPLLGEKGVVFLTPRLIAQNPFQEWRADRKLRQPVFLGLPDDKRPLEVRYRICPDEEYQPNLGEIGDHRIAYGHGKLVLGTCS